MMTGQSYSRTSSAPPISSSLLPTTMPRSSWTTVIKSITSTSCCRVPQIRHCRPRHSAPNAATLYLTNGIIRIQPTTTRTGSKQLCLATNCVSTRYGRRTMRSAPEVFTLNRTRWCARAFGCARKSVSHRTIVYHPLSYCRTI